MTVDPASSSSGKPSSGDPTTPELAALAGAGDQGEPTEVAEGLLDRFEAVRIFDERVDELFDRLRGNPVADRAFYAVTELGDFGLVWLLIGSARALRSDDDITELIRLATALGIESVVINGMVKSAFRRERPVIQEERPHRIRIPLTTSFPSGHASSAMLAASLLSDGRRTAPLYYALGLWVASSRVYVKIHHASDVVGGLAVGAALGAVARRVWPGPRSPRGRRTRRKA